MRRKECFDRIDQAMSHYQMATRMVDTLIHLAGSRPKHLDRFDLDLREMQALLEELHGVYFVRMFARFESDLRHYWRTSVRDTKPMTEVLLARIADRRGIPQDTLDDAHEVRVFRNFLTHEEHDTMRPITIDDGRRRMNAFLAWLPLKW